MESAGGRAVKRVNGVVVVVVVMVVVEEVVGQAGRAGAVMQRQMQAHSTWLNLARTRRLQLAGRSKAVDDFCCKCLLLLLLLLRASTSTAVVRVRRLPSMPAVTWREEQARRRVCRVAR